jgi:hypothetical protein
MSIAGSEGIHRLAVGAASPDNPSLSKLVEHGNGRVL